MDGASQMNVEPGIPPNAVSVLGDGADDFPVLKAFQQYIDAEQNKARKRMIGLCVFFGCLMTLVIVVFLILLNGVSQRNQALSDRLLDYMMKRDNDRQAAVVVQPSADASSVLGLAAKIDEMQKSLLAAQQKADEADRARAEAAARAEQAAKAQTAIRTAEEKTRLAEQLEIERLKKELADERKKAAQERERQREAELEAYRRKHYPEFYERRQVSPSSVRPASAGGAPVPVPDGEEAAVDALLDELSGDAVNYFEEDDEEGRPLPREKPAGKAVAPASYSIPVEVKGTRAKWRIPNA